jgi:hypothetical protein
MLAWLRRLRRLRSTLGAVRRRGKWESELDEELRGHREYRAADLVPPVAMERISVAESGQPEIVGPNS